MSVRDREGRSRDDLVVARLHALAPHLDGEPDQAWQASTRARLVAMTAVRSPAPAPVSPLRRLLPQDVPRPARWRTGLTAGLAGAALSVSALATLVAVATDAQPGGVLYGLKRGTEQTQLALAGDARGEVLLDLASTRLEEVRALVDTDTTALPPAGPSGSGGAVLAAGADAALVVETLATMDGQTSEGARWLTGRAVATDDAGPLGLLADWVTTQADTLAALRGDVPPEAGDEVLGSLGLLTDIAARVDGLESSLHCADGPAARGADELGPIPTLCRPEAITSPVPGAAGSGDGSTARAGGPQPGSAPAAGSPAGAPVPTLEGSVPGAPPGAVPGMPGGADDGVAPPPSVPPLSTGEVPATPLPSEPLPLPGTTGPPGATGTTGTTAGPTGTTAGPALPDTSDTLPPGTTPSTDDLCPLPIGLGDC